MDLKQHLLERKFDCTKYQHYSLDHENELAFFYLFDDDGRLTGYQKYNPNVFLKKVNNVQEGRYFNHNRKGEMCVWGLENLTPGPLFVTESIFKAAAIHMAGFNAITHLTSGLSKRFLAFCDHLGKDGLYFVGDNDEAGIKMSKYRPRGFVTEKDLDEYTTEELKRTIQWKIFGQTMELFDARPMDEDKITKNLLYFKGTN